MLKFFGFDPGTIKAGWACIDSDLFHHGSGLIQARAKDPIEKRLAKIDDDLTYHLLHHKPDIIVVEKAFYKKIPGKGNVLTTIRLGEARAVALILAGRLGTPVLELAPASIKKAVTGKGNASKALVGYWVAEQLHISQATDDNISDAQAVAFAGAYLFKQYEKLGSVLVETVKGIEAAIKEIIELGKKSCPKPRKRRSSYMRRWLIERNGKKSEPNESST